MTRVYWDTIFFIYWFENHPVHAPRVDHIFRSIQSRGDRLCASYLTVGEIVAGPLKQKDSEGAAKVERFFDSGLVELLPFDRKSVGAFAHLRANQKVSPADAIHLACAGAGGVDLFLTNDKGLQRMKVPGIHFIAGLDVNLF